MLLFVKSTGRNRTTISQNKKRFALPASHTPRETSVAAGLLALPQKIVKSIANSARKKQLQT
jgi:hypothetical protein